MSEPKLTLYHFDSCPFCQRVRHAAHSLGLDIPLADIHASPQHRQELAEARGRTTVPVLKIEDGDHTTWLPESADIVRYLQAKYA